MDTANILQITPDVIPSKANKAAEIGVNAKDKQGVRAKTENNSKSEDSPSFKKTLDKSVQKQNASQNNDDMNSAAKLDKTAAKEHAGNTSGKALPENSEQKVGGKTEASADPKQLTEQAGNADNAHKGQSSQTESLSQEQLSSIAQGSKLAAENSNASAHSERQIIAQNVDTSGHSLQTEQAITHAIASPVPAMQEVNAKEEGEANSEFSLQHNVQIALEGELNDIDKNLTQLTLIESAKQTHVGSSLNQDAIKDNFYSLNSMAAGKEQMAGQGQLTQLTSLANAANGSSPINTGAQATSANMGLESNLKLDGSVNNTLSSTAESSLFKGASQSANSGAQGSLNDSGLLQQNLSQQAGQSHGQAMAQSAGQFDLNAEGINRLATDVEGLAAKDKADAKAQVKAGDAARLGNLAENPIRSSDFEVKSQVGSKNFNVDVNNHIAYVAKNGGGNAKIKLNPAYLGPVEASVKIASDGGVSIQIQANHNSTRDALEQGSARLKEMLQEQGFAQVDVNVSEQGLSKGDRQSSHQTGGLASQSKDGDQAGEVNDIEENHSPTQSVINGVVDYYA